MFNYLKKEISTSTAIGIVLVLAVLVGGFTLWQYSEFQREEFKEEMNIPEKELHAEIDIEKYLREDMVIHEVSMPPEAEYQAIPEEEAILITIRELEKEGTKDIKVRHLLWTVAPVGEFFIAGDCSLTRENNQYSKFMAKVNDGPTGEPRRPTLIFKGTDIWYSNLPSDEWLEEIVANYETVAEEIYYVNSVFKDTRF